MRKLLAVLLLALPTACDDGSECEPFASCFPGEVVVRFDIQEQLFPARAQRAGQPAWLPGDSLAVRVTVENQTNAAIDSLVLTYASTVLAGNPSVHLGRIAANQRVTFVDTVRVPPFVFEPRASLVYHVVDPGTFELIDVRAVGDTSVQVMTAGLDIEVLTMPASRMFTAPDGSTRLYPTLRAHTDAGFLIRIKNSYETATQPVALQICLADIDYCGETFDFAPLIPSLAPGSTHDIEATFNVRRHDKMVIAWNWMFASLELCPVHLFDTQTCRGIPVVVLPNLEVVCQVRDVTPGVLVTDAVAECGADDEGSAYRFSAVAGERYRVEVTTPGASGFITDRDGIPRLAQPGPELTIPQTGTYYVVLRHLGPVAFTLVKTQ